MTAACHDPHDEDSESSHERTASLHENAGAAPPCASAAGPVPDPRASSATMDPATAVQAANSPAASGREKRKKKGRNSDHRHEADHQERHDPVDRRPGRRALPVFGHPARRHAPSSRGRRRRTARRRRRGRRARWRSAPSRWSPASPAGWPRTGRRRGATRS